MHLYSVTPESVSEHTTFDRDFRTRVTQAARACEEAGWSGILVPQNLHEVDPWVVAAHLGSVTESLTPLIAVQPAAAAPHTVASMAAAYAMLYGRPVHFNLVAGARDDELRRTGDPLDHDQRYERMREFGHVLRALLRGEEVDVTGRHYTYHGHRLQPRPAVLERCLVFVAGSSPAGLDVARDIADVVVTHPAPYPDWRRNFLEPLRASGYTGQLGIRIGIVAGEERADAWRRARARFPQTRRGRHETVLKTRSQNTWSRELAARAVAEDGQSPDPYWLGAFRSGHASAPFLVGTHEEVGARLAEYTRAGVSHVLLNGSYEDDHTDINRAVRAATTSAPPPSAPAPPAAGR